MNNSENYLILIKEWIRPLQKSLTIETENNFNNTLGKQMYFNDYLCESLTKINNLKLSDEYITLLLNIYVFFLLINAGYWHSYYEGSTGVFFGYLFIVSPLVIISLLYLLSVVLIHKNKNSQAFFFVFLNCLYLLFITLQFFYGWFNYPVKIFAIIFYGIIPLFLIFIVNKVRTKKIKYDFI